MNEKILAWIHGKYVSPIESREYGASVRSSYLINMISSIVGSSLIIDIGISRNRHFSVRSNRLFIGLPLSKRSLMLRGLNKLLLEKLKIISWKSAFSVVSIGIDYNKAEKLINYPIDLLVVDGPLGVVVSKSILGKIKWRHGSKVIYISHDFLSDKYSGFWLKRLLNAEHNILQHVDLLISASMRDEIKYRELYGISNKIVTFPNIYPLPNHMEFASNIRKQNTPTIVVVAGKALAKNPEYVRLIRKLYELSDTVKFNIIYVGKHPPHIAKPGLIEYYDYIPSRADYLETLGKGHIGLNYALFRGGSNVKKYDYSLSGLVILSNSLGVKGEWLPHEYVFMDEYDFVVKLGKLIELGVAELCKLGRLNLLKSWDLYNNSYKKLVIELSKLK